MRRRILTVLSTGTIAGALMFGVTLTGTSDHHSSAVAETVPVAIDQQEGTDQQGIDPTITQEQEQEDTPEVPAQQEQEDTPETETETETEQGAPIMVQKDQIGTVSEELPIGAPAPCHWVGLTVEQCDDYANPAPGTVSIIIVYGTTFSQVEEILIWQDGALVDISYTHVDQRPEW